MPKHSKGRGAARNRNLLLVGVLAHNDTHDSGISRDIDELVRPVLIQRPEVAALAFDNEPFECDCVAID